MSDIIIKSDRRSLERLIGELIQRLPDQPQSQRPHYRAAINWITKYSPPSGSTNLEKVHGSLEAFHHLCGVEEWEKAGILLSSPLSSLISEDNCELYRQLEIWGYYGIQIDMYETIENQAPISSDLCILVLRGLSNAYGRISNYPKAFYFSNKALNFARIKNNYQSMAIVMLNLGIAQQGLGNLEQAILSFQESLKLSRNQKFPLEEAKALGDLGNAYGVKRKFRKAIDYLEQSCKVARQIGDRMLEAQALGNLGNAYGCLRQYDKAAKYLKQYLTVAQEQENCSEKLLL